MKNEIVLYHSDELTERIEVRIDEDTVWLTQQQMASLFHQTKQNISLHIRNCFKEQELAREATVKDYLTVQKEGERTIKRKIEYYNLDIIISVGYRVKSRQGTQFRIWANRILKDYLLQGYTLNSRMNRIENNIESLKNKIDEIDLQINSHLIPNQGIFFDGQVFDAYEFASRVIRSARKSIILIDNYIDETTLTHLSKKQQGVKALILTKNLSNQLSLDIKKVNDQYGNFEIRIFTPSHDRFLIIDKSEIYHLGASLKDLGKKWFAFSKMAKSSVENILAKI